MKKLLIILLIIFINVQTSIKSQTIIKDDNFKGYKYIPQERIFVHHNTTLILTGESLQYKIYCLNNNTNKFSDISKIAYIELIDIDKKVIIKQKIKLENGLGQGDFFINTSIPSGNYKLIAYTQWMRNYENNFSQSDISIINPFQENQNSILVNPKDSILSENINKSKNVNSNNNQKNDYLELQINKHLFSKREKVALKINGLKDQKSYGKYSISVRKIDDLNKSIQQTTYTYKSNYNNITDKNLTNNDIYLPELRGELISGTVIHKETLKPVVDMKVSLSIPGKSFLFKIANTNEKGTFYFNIDKDYDSKYSILQVLNINRNIYKLTLNQQSNIKLNNLNFFDFKISQNNKDLILKHSIYNQIENAYSGKKIDSIKKINHINPFIDSNSKKYLLDDYTRFSTLEETIIEIIPEVYISQKKGESVFHVRIYDEEIESGLKPLVLVDGILLQNHNKLVDYNAKDIKQISIVDELYMYGSHIFEGVIVIETFNGNYKSNFTGDYVKEVELSKPILTKDYYNQNYENNKKFERIPDYRSQLLWQPKFTLNKKDNNIIFFTSDVSGNYEISLEGFTNEGNPVSIKEMIEVK